MKSISHLYVPQDEQKEGKTNVAGKIYHVTSLTIPIRQKNEVSSLNGDLELSEKHQVA